MDQAVMLGCALPTGAGSVINSGHARAGESIVVFGAGGIGNSAILGARAAGCAPIIAVDLNPAKLALAKACGATHTIDASVTDPLEAIKGLCPGGADLAIEATGVPTVMAQALASVRNQGGRAVVIGNAHHGDTLQINPRLFNDGKSLLGSWGGDSIPDRDYPRLARLMSEGRIDVSPILSEPYRLEDINLVLKDIESGRIGRPLIDMNLG